MQWEAYATDGRRVSTYKSSSTWPGMVILFVFNATGSEHLKSWLSDVVKAAGDRVLMIPWHENSPEILFFAGFHQPTVLTAVIGSVQA